MVTFTVRTTFKGATDTNGARVVAKSEGLVKRKQMTNNYAYQLNAYDNHLTVARDIAAQIASDWINSDDILQDVYSSKGWTITHGLPADTETGYKIKFTLSTK